MYLASDAAEPGSSMKRAKKTMHYLRRVARNTPHSPPYPDKSLHYRFIRSRVDRVLCMDC